MSFAHHLSCSVSWGSTLMDSSIIGSDGLPCIRVRGCVVTHPKMQPCNPVPLHMIPKESSNGQVIQNDLSQVV